MWSDGEEPTQNEVVGVLPECGKDLIKRRGRYGEFVGVQWFPTMQIHSCTGDKQDQKSEKT
jgi:DNA topoisomerase-1